MSAPILRLTASQRPVFLLNSRLGLFTAALSGLHPIRAPLLPKLRGHFAEFLTRVHSLTLEFSSRLPVSVCGTGTSHLARGFSWQREIRNFGTLFPSPSQLSLTVNGFAYSPALLLGRAYPTARLPYPSASPHCSNGGEVVQEYQPVIHRLRLSASA